MRFISRLTSILILLTFTAVPALAARRAEHVFIISFDGGKPAVMKQSKMPELNSLLPKAACTWEAQAAFPSLTLTSHTSMLTGVSPEKHHVLWNDWEPEHGMVTVPTIFALAKQQRLTTAMFVGKPKFIHLYQQHSLNEFCLPGYHCKIVAECAAHYIQEHKPNLCFIHFADSDGAGHAFGWGSEEQKQAFSDEDDALKTVMKAIASAGIQDSSVVILTADHGGHNRTHGTNSPEDMNIPWVVWGEGVKPGLKITAPVTTCDTAATALWLLDVPRPADFDGKPVTTAFEATDAAEKAQASNQSPVLSKASETTTTTTRTTTSGKRLRTKVAGAR